jgi:hypothetical protein
VKEEVSTKIIYRKMENKEGSESRLKGYAAK